MFACGKDYCEATPGKTGEAAWSGKHGHTHCREGPTSVSFLAATQVTAGQPFPTLIKLGYAAEKDFR